MARLTEHITLRHLLTTVHLHPCQIRIERMPPLAVVDDNDLTISAQLAGAVHAAIGHGAYRILAHTQGYSVVIVLAVARVGLNNFAGPAKI